MLEQRPLARIDHRELLVVVMRQRDSCRTARLAVAAERLATGGGALATLTNLLLSDTSGGPEGARTRHACFNRAVATRPVKDR